MTLYRGWRRPNGRRDVVRSNGRRDEWLQRPPGRPSCNKVEWLWGCPGDGSLELGRALLADVGMPASLVELWVVDFVADVVSHLVGNHWSLSSEDVCNWIIDQAWKEIQAGRREKKGESNG